MDQEFENIDSTGQWQNLYNVSRTVLFLFLFFRLNMSRSLGGRLGHLQYFALVDLQCLSNSPRQVLSP